MGDFGVRVDMIEPSVVMDGLSTAVVVLDKEGRVRVLNAAAESLLEVSANQVIGHPFTRFLPRGPGYKRVLDAVARRQRPVTEREIRIDVSAQKSVTVDCTVTPVAGEDYMIVELVSLGHYQRITHEEQLVTQNESIRLLLRGLAHEIRNPLGGLRGAAQLLGEELGESALRDYTQVIIREADRLQELMSRMLGPSAAPRLRVGNIHEVTEHVIQLIGAEAPASLTIRRHYDPSIPELEFDDELMIQAVLNVGRNAVQALGGQGTLTVRTRIHNHANIGSRQHRMVVAIDVIDDGPGVPEALRDIIFYPMVTGRDDGTGLGLSIAQSLVNRHGGLIEFARHAGETHFSILLPMGGHP